MATVNDTHSAGVRSRRHNSTQVRIPRAMRPAASFQSPPRKRLGLYLLAVVRGSHMCPRSISAASEEDKGRKGRRLLTPTRVIKKKPRERLTPVFQHSHQFAT